VFADAVAVEAVTVSGVTEDTYLAVVITPFSAKPAGTVIVAGTGRTFGFEELTATANPPTGAGPFRNTLTATDWPPEVEVGER
jgi:hypothetical protein